MRIKDRTADTIVTLWAPHDDTDISVGDSLIIRDARVTQYLGVIGLDVTNGSTVQVSEVHYVMIISCSIKTYTDQIGDSSPTTLLHSAITCTSV